MTQGTAKRVSWWGKSSYTATEIVHEEQRAISALGQTTILSDNEDCDIAIVHSGLRVDNTLLAGFPSVKWIITTTSGYDHIDVEALLKRDIGLIRMPLLRRDAVVESTLMNLLYSTRQQSIFTHSAQNNQWVRPMLNVIRPKRLSDCTIGVVGCGVIGTRVIDKLLSLDANVVACDPKGTPETVPCISFDAMASECDAITFHCNLSSTSRNMVNLRWLQQVPTSIALVNTARGSILDPVAVKEGLCTGKISFLGIDVFPHEPPADIDWWGAHPNVLCSPHAAGYHPKLAEMRREKLTELITCILEKRPIEHRVPALS